jgi:hypothetical protein
MKLPVLLACVVLAVGVLQAQTKTAPLPADAQPAPGKAVTPGKQPAKKEAPLPTIPGTEIARPDGTFLGLEVVGGNFKLSFYDKKKKVTGINVTRAAARWPNPRAPGDNRTILNPSGNALVGAKPVVPPFNFNVYLTLLQGEGDKAEAVEHYVVRFKD